MRFDRRQARALMLLGVMGSMACGSTRAVTPEMLQRPDAPERVIVTTRDHRRLVVGGPLVVGDVLVGKVLECDGAALLPPAPPRAPGNAPQRQSLTYGCVKSGTRVTIPTRVIGAVGADDGISRSTAGGIIFGASLVGAAAIVGVTFAVVSETAKRPEPKQSSFAFGSCPRVYSFDGQGWHLDSGTYGSALFEAGQQTDHDLLEHLIAVDGSYHLKLANELDETEHVDAMELVVVDHAAGYRVVPAPDGELLSFEAPKPPLSATDLRGTDALEQVATRDGKLWQSDLVGRDAERPADTRDGLTLVFPKPKGARTLKLWLTGSNTRTASAIVFHLMALQGDQLPKLYERLNSSALARMLLRRLFVGVGLLPVSVRTRNGWVQRGVFEAAGNEVAKAQALRIPIDDIPGDRVELRLESAVGMWTIDSVVVDYGADIPMSTQRLAPKRALTHDHRDITTTLSQVDGARWSSEQGDWARLTFTAPPPVVDKARSIVLRTTGYDTLHVPPAANPDPTAANALMLSPTATSRRVLQLLQARR